MWREGILLMGIHLLMKGELFKNIPEQELDRALDNKQNGFITGTRKTTQYTFQRPEKLCL